MTGNRRFVSPAPQPAAPAVLLPQRRAVLALGLAAMGAAGCVPVLGGGATLDAFDLAPPPSLPLARNRAPIELVIELPAVPGALDTDRILVRPDPLRAQYLPGARWTQDAPEVLRTLFIHGFEATGGLRLAGRRPLGSFADYRLSTEVVAFQIDATAQGVPPQAEMRVMARLVNERARSAPAARAFAARVPVTEAGTLGYVRALNTAAGQVLTQMTGWALGQMGVAVRPAAVPAAVPATASPPPRPAAG